MTLPLERKLQWTALLGAVPALALALARMLAPRTGYRLPLGIWGLALALAALAAWKAASRIRVHMLHPLQTLSNLLAALREGDYSFRARGEVAGDALGQVFGELNTLSELLQQRRFGFG